MKNNQKNAFTWGNYDYSNLSSEITKKIENSNNQFSNDLSNSLSSSKNKDSNQSNNTEIKYNELKSEEDNSSKIKNKIISPIKSKIKQGVDKISSSTIISSISSKFSKAPIHSDNPSGIVINKENSMEIITKIEEKEKYMKKLEKKEQTEALENEFIEHDEETGLPIVSEYQLNCIIDEFKDRVVGKEHVIFYKLEIFSSLSGRRWDLYHSFQEFYDLYLVYKKYFLDIPDIDFGKFSPKIVNQPLVHRELISKLNLFINSVIKKPALITSCYIINFLKLQNHFSDILIYKPLLFYDSKTDTMNESVFNSNKLSINAIYYIQAPKLLLIGTGFNEDSLYNSVKNKISKLFKSQDPTFGTYGKANTNNICRGQFIVYNIIKNNNNEVMFVELKYVDVISDIIKFDFWSEKNYVAISLKNGQILLFKIYINESYTNEIVEYIGTINEHFSKPLCCIINFTCGYSYSFGEYEKTIKICDINYQNLIKEIDILKNKKSKGIICVDYTISLEYVYIQDDNGSIYFIDMISDCSNPYIIEEFPKFLPTEKNSLGEKDKGKIIKIKNSYYLLIGGVNKNKKNKECLLSIYLIQFGQVDVSSGNEKISITKLREIYIGAYVTITDVNINNNEDIIISLSNGSISIFNRSYSYPEYIIDAHLQYIPGFIWIEDQKMIITASHDKTIKLYQFPLKWPAEFLRKNKQVNDLSIIKEVKYETKNAYDDLYLNNSNFYYYEKYQENKKKKKKNNEEEKNNNEYNFNNNEIINDFWKMKEQKDNKTNEDKYDNDDLEEEYEEDKNYNENIVYDKPEKYEKYEIIFSDDLDGWSK